MPTVKITSNALNFILGVSSNVHPKEFTGQLRAENNTITEILVIPASTFGKGFAMTRFDMIPIDKTIIGSVHSHPRHNFKPSKADLRYFKKRGKAHLIVRYPYRSVDDMAAYTSDGERIAIEVIEQNE